MKKILKALKLKIMIGIVWLADKALADQCVLKSSIPNIYVSEG